RDESRAQGISQGRREDKAARLDAENYVDLRLAVVILEAIDDGAEAAGVLEERGDVVEQDPRFREVRDLANELFQVFHLREGTIVSGASARDLEAGILLYCGILLVDTADVAPARTGMQGAREFREGSFVAGRVHFHAAVIQIAGVAGQAEALRMLLGEVSESDSLYVAANEPAPREFAGHVEQ